MTLRLLIATRVHQLLDPPGKLRVEVRPVADEHAAAKQVTRDRIECVVDHGNARQKAAHTGHESLDSRCAPLDGHRVGKVEQRVDQVQRHVVAGVPVVVDGEANAGVSRDLFHPGHHVIGSTVVIKGARNLDGIDAKLLAELAQRNALAHIEALHARN